ncbi:leucine-rich repeat-containing protein 53 [Rhineura floridana]|uniref:leucine-rich repeat-containing protein 53 n=1 Tax=Rhineura floridana TaxID=261503 RepID=UPI002AC803EF|nr:leucine-rich repeat-containing protein 53 [Rhineura floridana]
MIQLIASCPSSCVVCSEDITLCQGLTYILAVPASTKALIVTDGNITSVEGFNLSFLFNATLLRLSTNGIITIRDDAFLGLRTLKTLLLDQNQISSSSITYSTFHEVQKLQVLVLSNNVLSSIHGTWFKNMKDLIRLHLNGNQIISITGKSFEMANLGNLRILDLSNNFISSIEKRAFHGLTQLMEINLSRNRLAVIPDTFSSLTQLSLLSLDQNWWNCTCKLYDLASFLRKYVNSTSRMLTNADNMSCRASENPSVINLLELTEVNCKSALKRPPDILKNRRSNYGRDVTLVAVFSFLGGVGLTCLVLALFNRKFQHGKANERSSGNCCCRTLDESQCGHEARNYLTKGYCNCHLTWENEIKVMSMLGSGREMPLLTENSHQESVKAEPKCTGLKMPLRSIQKENEQMKNDNFLCLNCRLLQSYPQESSGNTAGPNEADVLHQKHFRRRVRSPENFGQWEEDTRSEDHPKLNQGIRSDTFCRRCSRAVCALAKERLGKQSANELCQSLSKIEEDNNCLKGYRPKQRHLITASDTPEESKEYCGRTALESYRSQQSGSLERSKNISPQLDNFLTCKYIDYDKYHDVPTEKKQDPSKNVKLDEEQSEVKSKRADSCCMSDEEVPLSPAIKRLYQPKNVSFYVPDLATVKRMDVTNGLSEVRTLENKRQHKCIQGNPSPALVRRLHSDPEAKTEERKPSPTSVGPGGKENEYIQKHKIKTKRQDYLTVKLNLQPFRKARIHPEEHLHKENKEECPCCQHTKLPHASKKKEKRKRKSENSVGAQEISECNKNIICSRAVVGKVCEENGTDTVISCSSRGISAMTDSTSSAKHLQTPTCTKGKPLFSPNGTSRMTVSVLSPDHSSGLSQSTANYIPLSVNSKELNEDAIETAVLAFHQNSLKTATKEKDHSLSPAVFIQRESFDLLNPSNEDNLQLQQITENVMQNMDLEQVQNQQLKQQDENLTMKDCLEGCERAVELESAQRHLVTVQSHSFNEILPCRHQSPTENDTNRPKSPAHFSSALSHSQANGCITIKQLQKPDRANDMEEYGIKTESNSELAKMFIPDTQMDSAGLNEEGAQTGGEWENNECKTFHKNIVKVTIISSTSSVPSSPETGNTHLESNINLETNNNVHMDNESNLQEAPNNQLDEGSNEHKEGKMPPATHQAPSLLAKFKDVNYEEQTVMSSLRDNTNKAEISVFKPTLSPTSADYDKELPSQAEQSKVNISNNSYPSLVLFRDKKPFSI